MSDLELARTIMGDEVFYSYLALHPNVKATASDKFPTSKEGVIKSRGMETTDLETIAKGKANMNFALRKPCSYVIKTPEEAKKFIKNKFKGYAWGKVREEFNKTNFSTHLIVGATYGIQPFNGPEMEITKVRLENGKYEVEIKELKKAKVYSGDYQVSRSTQPFQFVRIKRLG